MLHPTAKGPGHGAGTAGGARGAPVDREDAIVGVIEGGPQSGMDGPGRSRAGSDGDRVDHSLDMAAAEGTEQEGPDQRPHVADM